MNNFQKVNEEVKIEEVVRLCEFDINSNGKLSQCPYHPDDSYHHANIVPGENFVFCHCNNEKQNLSVVDYYRLVNNLTPNDSMRELADKFDVNLTGCTHKYDKSKDKSKWSKLHYVLSQNNIANVIKYLTDVRKIDRTAIDAMKSEKILLMNKNLKVSKDSKIVGEAFAVPIRSFISKETVGFRKT